MSPVPVGRLLVRDGQEVLDITYPTDRECAEKPELAIGVLVCAIWMRYFEISASAEGAAPPAGLFNVLWEWVYRDQPLIKRDAFELTAQQDNEWDPNSALTRIKRRGRPVKSRRTAIQALFRKVYLNRSWEEVTRRLCQCGQSHDDRLTLIKCQANLESEARHLKRELKKYQIAFPPVPPKRGRILFKAGETSQMRAEAELNIPTLEESSGAMRKADTYSIQHPVVRILLDGPLPEIEVNGEPHRGDESDALNLFNPWVPGWIPFWFPEICSSGPIESKKEYQQRRYGWFDKALKHFAGPDWPLKGSLEKQKKVIARTLIQMYRAARDEQIPEIDKL